jgi:hypothetical protein
MNSTLRRALACTALAAASLTLTACFAPPTVAQTAKPTAEPIDAGGEPTSTPTGVPIDDDDIDGPDAPSGFTAVFDDTRHLGALLPDTWTDTEGAGYVDGDGRDWLSLQAAVDLGDWDQYWGEPGVQLGASALLPKWTDEDITGEIANLHDFIVDTFGYAESCTTVDDAESYSDQIYTGVISTFEDCPSDSMSFVLAASDSERTHELYLELTLPGGLDDEANTEILDQLLNSFQASFDSSKASRG